MSDQKVYISGPMEGLPGRNYGAFNAVESEIINYGFDGTGPNGYQVLNPAKNFGGEQDTATRQQYMQEALTQLLSAQIIIQLPGWYQSPGAALEAHLGVATGKRFFEATWQNYGTVAQPKIGWGFREVPATDEPAPSTTTNGESTSA